MLENVLSMLATDMWKCSSSPAAFFRKLADISNPTKRVKIYQLAELLTTKSSGGRVLTFCMSGWQA